MVHKVDMCVLKCFKYKIKNNIIIKIFILMAYFIHKYMFKNTKAIHWLFRSQNDFIWGCTHLGFLFCFFSGGEGRMLQICQSASFVSNSLSIPFPKDCCQVFLDCHLLSVAAVAVCEDPVRVSLGQRLWAVVQCFPPAGREGEKRQFSTPSHWYIYIHMMAPCMYSLWCWGEEPGHLN